jgi:signal transduction histidine kinase/CheY-like chemotaxis protein
LQSESRHHSSDALWLGRVVIPRNRGICGIALENALKTPDTGEDYVTIFSDMRGDGHCQGAAFVEAGPQLRFYAGVPIRTAGGAAIGILSVFDDKPRATLSDDQKTFLRDMAQTAMDHIEVARLRDQNARNTQLVMGLRSFIDGLADLKSPKEATQRQITPFSDKPQDLAMLDVNAEAPRPGSEAEFPGLAPRSMWDLAMPPGSKPMFTRAANIIRQSGDYDGVAFFYMPSANPTKLRSSRNRSVNGADTPYSEGSSGSERTGPGSDAETSNTERPSKRSTCPLLSYSLATGSSSIPRSGPFPGFKQRDLDRLIAKGAKARAFTLNQAGDVLPGDTSSSGSGAEEAIALAVETADTLTTTSVDGEAIPRDIRLQRRLVKSLRTLSPTALSYACMPLWDFERRRFLAYCICWSSLPSRRMKEDGDLDFLRIFGNSIAITLSHIDAIASNRAKSNFVASMSHELRSPLHGVLSASTFLNDSSLSPFQREMVHTITNCGRTLLDTVDHVMDFAKVSSLAPKLGRGLSTTHNVTPTMQSTGDSNQSSLSANVDLSVLIEEVVEAVLMGFSVQHDFIYNDEDPRANLARAPTFVSTATSLAKTRRSKNSRGRVRLVLQLPYHQNWTIHTQPGAWRRIVMNLFGNALKYTNDGLIAVRVDPMQHDHGKMLPISLSVVDTGKGMSKQYMNTHLYTPFSQEDELSNGTGLGLSIVKQIVEALGGAIKISSSQGLGTSANVKLAVPTASAASLSAELTSPIEAVAKRLFGQQVFIVKDTSRDSLIDSRLASSRQAELELCQALSMTLKDSWPTEADLIICLEPLLRYFDPTAGNQVAQQPVILITHDALEMAVLRADARITRTDAVIQLVSQPLGPHKLARTLEHCLDRQESLPAAGIEEALSKASSQSQLSILSSQRSLSPVLTLQPSPLGRQSGDILADRYRDPFVLIVDDNRVNLRLLSVFIKKQSLRYHEASNGLEALDIFTNARGSVRCVLLDISMPLMDGITATRHIREFEKQEKLPRTPVIALTGLTSASARNEAQEAGMDDFLTKPISFTQLRGILAQIGGL